MSAQADDGVARCVQTDITLESGAISVPLALGASPGLCAASAAGDSRSSGGRAVTRAPLLLCGLHPLSRSLCSSLLRLDVTQRYPVTAATSGGVSVRGGARACGVV